MNADTSFTRRVRRRASGCRSRPSTRRAATTRRRRCSTRSRPHGQVVLRYAPGQNPNGSLRDIAGVTQRARQRVRPDAAPRARRRRADRLDRRAADLRVDGADRAGRACLTRRRCRPSRRPSRSASPTPSTTLIVEKLGREPNAGRAGDVLACSGREHCAYKHSQEAAAARCRPRASAWSMGPGENAGAVDVGDGLAVAFKVESHNHPSAVEPFQGAATGVGGILRDIFALGARPIAVLDSLRFGELDVASARATCSTARCAGSATTATRSASRRSAARSTSRRPTSRTASSTRCASGSPGRERARAAARRPGVGNALVLYRRLDRPRRHRRRLGARLAPSSARATRTSARRCRSATRSRSRSSSSAASSCSSRGCSSRSRTSAPPG